MHNLVAFTSLRDVSGAWRASAGIALAHKDRPQRLLTLLLRRSAWRRIFLKRYREALFFYILVSNLTGCRSAAKRCHTLHRHAAMVPIPRIK
jgi:hypothetical protein